MEDIKEVNKALKVLRENGAPINGFSFQYKVGLLILGTLKEGAESKC